jgi:hypothetical protein
VKWGGADGSSIGNRDNQIQSGAIAATPNVNIAKADNANSSVAAGGTFIWNITLTVSGGATTAAATVSDTLPTGFSVNSAFTFSGTDPGKLSCLPSTPIASPAAFTCTLASGAAVGTYVIAVHTTAPSASCGLFTNTATVAGGGGTNTINSAPDDIDVTSCVGGIVVHKEEAGFLANASNTWNFSLSGGTAKSDIAISDAGTNSWTGLAGGTYTVTELNSGAVAVCSTTVPGGAYVATHGTSSNPVTVGQVETGISVVAGQTTHVYFKNTGCPGTIAIAKSSSPETTVAAGGSATCDTTSCRREHAAATDTRLPS